MSRIPCKYFAQGNCRWGNACRFAHTQNATSSYDSALGNLRSGAPDVSGLPGANTEAVRRKADQIGLDFGPDMPKWPLSSYGFQDEPCILRGLDWAPEELRLEYYTNQQNYLQNIGPMIAKAAAEYKKVKENPVPTAQYAQMLANKQPTQPTANWPFPPVPLQPRPVPPTNFVVAAPAPSPFSQPNASPFGVPPPQEQSSPFGAPNHPPSMFGAPQQTQPFGAVTIPPPQTTNSPFRAGVQPPAANPFSIPPQQPGFGNGPTSSAFARAPQPVSSPLAQNQLQPSTFSTAFGQQQQQPIAQFPGSAPSAGVFGQPSTQPPAFGHSAVAGGFLALGQSNPQPPLDIPGLDPEAQQAFMADQFTFGKIPETPPPPQLCI